MRDYVSFSQDTFHATVYLPRLTDLPMKNLRKMFSIVLWDDRENWQAIQAIGLYLESIVPDCKKLWDEASVKYQREWRLIEKPTRRRTRKEIEKTAAIRAHNDELTKAVKRAKSQYEHWVKIQALWNDTKQKMNIK